jgi:hypothetical protein
VNFNDIWAYGGGAALLYFLVFEVWAVARDPKRGDGKQPMTLSAHLRKWMGIEPKAKRRWVFMPAFGGFLVWFFIHILTPWL